MEFLDSGWEVKRLHESGAFAGYASVFHVVDGQRDVVMPGAFRKSLAARAKREHAVKLLWQHAPQEPVGVFTELREDEVGLYAEGRLLLDVQRAREAYSLLKSGALDGLSIGFKVQESEVDPHTGVRRILEAELLEISLVTFPANREARVISVKSGGKKPETLREMEALLRFHGFSHRQARDIAVKGFQSEEALLLKALERAERTLRETGVISSWRR